jgi:hypothetical protein
MKPNAPEGEELLKKIGLDRTTENVIDLRIWGLGVRILQARQQIQQLTPVKSELSPTPWQKCALLDFCEQNYFADKIPCFFCSNP